MSPDNFETAWQSQGGMTVKTDLLIQEMQRIDKTFTATIFWRDVREIGVAAFLVPIWFLLGWGLSLPWAWYLTVPALLWAAGFMLADRIRHGHQRFDRGASLREGVENSLAHVEHQMWLLRNIHWWYLLPLLLPMLAFVGQVAWLASSEVWQSAAAAAFLAAILIGVIAIAYWLNQRAVRTELEPLRQQLQATLLGLTDDETAAGNVS